MAGPRPVGRRRPPRSLPLLVALLALLGSTAAAFAQQSSLTLRGNYWRDRNTRVIAPEAVLRKEFPTGTTVEAAYMLDAITSASVSAGVQADEPFTELRSDAGLRVSQRAGIATFNANYRYSTESDYWSHSLGAGGAVELLQKNLTLGLNYTWTHALVARRADAKSYVFANGDNSNLETHTAIATASQVLSRRALIELGYQLVVQDGYQANPYRFVRVSGSQRRETVPLFRVRHTPTVGLRWTPVYRAGPLRYLTLYPRYAFYTDSWGVTAHVPELRAYLALGPVELRLTGRYMTQGAATFFRANPQSGIAEYDREVEFANCPLPSGTSGTGGTCATGDSKLSAFTSTFVEGRVLLELSVLDQPWMPLRSVFGRSWVAISAGRYWNSGFANNQYGDAWVGGVEVFAPL